jgi:D-alanine-D-alanine ligase-like ATP-grasp enzyme
MAALICALHPRERYVIEANPNPWLSSKQEFAMAAKASGRSYTQLIGEIVEMAMARNTREAKPVGA